MEQEFEKHIYLEFSDYLKQSHLTFAQLFSCRGFVDSISIGPLPVFRGLPKQVLGSVLEWLECSFPSVFTKYCFDQRWTFLWIVYLFRCFS